MKKEKNDFPLRTAAKEIKISFVLTAVVDLILGVILLFAPEHVTDVLVMLISAGITIYGVFNILSFIFSRGMTAYSFELLIGICARRSAFSRSSVRASCRACCSSYSA